MNKLFILAPTLFLCAPFAATRPTRAADSTESQSFEQPATPRPAKGAKDTREAEEHFNAGRFDVDELYRARTGYRSVKYRIVAQNRPWLEYVYAPADAARLDAAIADLERVPLESFRLLAKTQADDEFGEAIKNAGLATIRNMSYESYDNLALARLEKAQFVTNAPADFAAVNKVFDDKNEERKLNDMYYDAGTRWKKSGPLMAAHLRALVGAGYLTDAFRIYNLWRQDTGSQPEMAITAMVEALDMVGDFNTARGVVVSSAVAQIQKDGGKYVPANQQMNRLALSIYYRHLEDASKIVPSPTMLPLQRARYAGALMFKRERNADEVAFIKAAPALIQTATGKPAPAATRLFAAKLKLEGDATEKAEADKLIASVEGESSFTTPALSVKGHSYLLKNSVPAATVALDQAIKNDPFLAYAYNAQRFRMGLYRQTGQPELAEQDQKQIMQLDRLQAQMMSAQG